MQHWDTFHQDNNFALLRLCAEKSEILCMLKKTMGENPQVYQFIILCPGTMGDGTIYTRDIEVLMGFWACQNILCTALNLANFFSYWLYTHSLGSKHQPNPCE